VAVLDLDTFQRFYEEVDLGPSGSIALARTDGLILVRHPYEASNVGRDLSSAILFREKLKEAPGGTYETVAVADGVPRVVSYRRLETVPLVLVASYAKADILAQWRQDSPRDLAIPLAAALALTALGPWRPGRPGTASAWR
jgi:hypothetical protein